MIEEEQPKSLQDAGEIIFKRLESKGALFNQRVHNPLSIHQRKTNTNFILFITEHQYKTYKIKDNQLQFVSSHIIEFPILSNWSHKMFSEDYLHYFFDKSHIEKRESALKFFKDHKIDWETPSWITFGWKMGTDQPKRIHPFYLGESKNQQTASQETNILDIYDNQKPLLNSTTCLFMKNNEEEADPYRSEAGEAYFLSHFDKKYPDFANHFFKFNLKAEKLFDYQKKLIEDFEKISPKVSKINSFFQHCQCLLIQNTEPGKVKKLMPFTQVDNYMIIVGLVDMRKRTIPIKRLVSMYELLSQFEFKHAPSVEFFNIIKIDYCVELDLLIMDTWINFYFDPEYNRDSIQSVILNRIEERVASGNLGFLSEISDGRIKEVQKLRFMVWGLLKSRKRRLEVEILGYRGSQSFSSTEGMVATFEDTTSEIRLRVYSAGANARHPTNTEIQSNVLERKPQKALRKSQGVKKIMINITKIKLLSSRGFQGNGIRTAFMVNQDHLLVTSSRHLLLFDINIKNIISDLQYCQKIPAFFEETKIYQDIMVSLRLRFNVIETFKISNQGEREKTPCFEYLGILDFSDCVENLFEVDALVAFRGLDDDVYEIVVVAKMMESPECTVVSRMLFLVQFRLPGKGERYKKITYMTSVCDVDFSQEDIRVYNKNDLWNHIFFDGVETEVIQNDEDDETTLIFNDLHRFKTDHYKITNVHIDRDLIFIEFTGEKDKLLKVVHASREDEDGELVEAELERTISLDLSVAVYFDEVTDLTRIFILEKDQELIKTQITIIDLELDEVEIFLFPWLDEFTKFKVIDSETLHIIGKEPPTPNEVVHPEDKEAPNVSIRLNLEDQTFQRLVVKGEGPLLYVPHELEGGQLLAFRRDYVPVESINSDGIFFSEN